MVVTVSIETSSSSESEGVSASMPVQYLQDHIIHVLVVIAFAVYPWVYTFLTDTLGLVAASFLPQMPTMLAILWLGLFTISFDFISGYTGYLSFGHAAFFGTGSYFVILAYNGKIPLLPGELPFMVLMLLAGVVAVILAFLIGLVSFRLTGVYFAMITLGFSEILYVIAGNWRYLTEREGADPAEGITATGMEPTIGIPGVDQLNVITGSFGDALIAGDAIWTSYFVIGVIVLVCYLIMQRIIHSPFGRVMIAIRENEERARAIGYRTIRYKLGAFMMSAFFGAIAGTLMVAFNYSASPDDSFIFLRTGFALVASIIGGLGTLAGPLYGYVFLEGVEEFVAREGSGGGLQPLITENVPESVTQLSVGPMTVDEIMAAFLTGHGEFYAGIIFVLFVLYVPIGILGTIRLQLGGQTVAKFVSNKIQEMRTS